MHICIALIQMMNYRSTIVNGIGVRPCGSDPLAGADGESHNAGAVSPGMSLRGTLWRLWGQTRRV
jgi:hypothetical protein